ncbi:3',5'-cyclic-nucleotide phosphodiesterase [Larkinella knui]|uniref:3',5'-cyclic-nucleotide phosphodiesterase n=1 Tax=Larkinella knui TaxID=2025310 RepID=A0A3P1CDZ2_9BACT|nr:3',5'-cyclic-nucleotide phosphodiesterase [Larkinella knui]RRB11532.1 3',5'-cyclic-nucleotide phosphodiesterase [Larkinella knui]
MSVRILLFFFFLPVWSGAFAQKPATSTFKILPLGVKGGIDESNLSAYLLAPQGTDQYICLDAGTLHAGIEKAVQKHVFSVSSETVLKDYIKAYLISHAHLDHLAGLIINSTEDARKPIYGMTACIDVLKKNYFNWKSWPNLANEGDQPALGKYRYTVLSPGNETPIEATGMRVRTFPLSHGNSYQSAAFLINSGDSYMLYLGDTGPDLIEKSTYLSQLWQAVYPLIQSKKLKGILIEVSYPNEQPDNQLYGHLTPNWLMHEMANLGKLTGENILNEFPVVITHIKPAGKNEERIKQQLREVNTLKLKLIFPEQGTLLEF